jgi:hypothetical protein
MYLCKNFFAKSYSQPGAGSGGDAGCRLSKWRAMRTNGVSERFITGNATPFEKFQAWARWALEGVTTTRQKNISEKAQFQAGKMRFCNTSNRLLIIKIFTICSAISYFDPQDEAQKGHAAGNSHLPPPP